MKKGIFIGLGILFLVFSLIFGLRSCNSANPNGKLDITESSFSDYNLSGKNISIKKPKTTKDKYFKIEYSQESNVPKRRFNLSITRQGLDASLNEEIEIPLKYKNHQGEWINEILISSIHLPLEYYDYIDKLTYNADKGYSIYLGEDYPNDSNINWDRVKKDSFYDFGVLRTNRYICSLNESGDSATNFNVYLADGNGGYAPFNEYAQKTELRLASKSFIHENIGYIILTALHAVMLFLLIFYEIKNRHEESTGAGNILAIFLFTISIGYHVYGIATQKMDSPLIVGSTLLSVFAFLLPVFSLFLNKRIVPAIFCIAAAIGEYISYSILYYSSPIAQPNAYAMGSIIALFAFAGLYMLMFAAFEEEFSSTIVSWLLQFLLLALLCVLSIACIAMGSFWIGLVAGSLLLTIFLFILGIGGGGYTVYIIFFD